MVMCSLTAMTALAEAAAPATAAIEELAERVAALDVQVTTLAASINGLDGEARVLVEEQLAVARTSRAIQQRALHRLVTGMEPRYMDIRSDDSEVMWEDEARALLSPLFVEFREATELPRRVGRLRRRATFLRSSLPQIEHAMVKAAEAMHTAPTPESQEVLREMRAQWLAKRDETKERLAITVVELSQIEAEHASMKNAGTRLWNLMTEKRTQRFALAVVAFLVTFLTSHMLHRMLSRLPFLRRLIGEDIGMRVFALSVHLLGTVGAVGVLLLMLYSSGDWVLLTLSIVGLVSIALGARSAAPRFLREIQLLLNAGPVRQGERLVWNGVPWRVQSLQLTTILSNPAFSETSIVRLPLRSLDSLISRPGADDEPWFPTAVGDVVEWDGLAAQVTRQGPEFVELIRDRSRITVPTPEFVASSPTNLSQGFRHRVVLKLDRRHDKEAAHAIPERLETLVRAAVAEHPSGEHMNQLLVSFEAISSWSLDLELEADFDGAAAGDWEELMELVQRSVLTACVSENWTMARSDYV